MRWRGRRAEALLLLLLLLVLVLLFWCRIPRPWRRLCFQLCQLRQVHDRRQLWGSSFLAMNLHKFSVQQHQFPVPYSMLVVVLKDRCRQQTLQLPIELHTVLNVLLIIRVLTRHRDNAHRLLSKGL